MCFMISIWFSIWFRYDFDMPKFMIFLWFWSLSVFLIWFWYDFLMVLESLRFFDMILIWFSYGFGVSPFFLIWFSSGFGVPPFSWYDFLMVLGCLRLFDMISLLFSSGHISHPRRRTPAHTSHPPLVGPQPHLPRPSPDPPPIPSPDSGTTEELSDFKLWFSFWFFWISRHVAACYRPTEFSLNISFTILWVRLARRRRSFQCCCRLTEFRV